MKLPRLTKLHYVLIVAFAVMIAVTVWAAPGEVRAQWEAGQPGTDATVTAYEVLRNGVSVGKVDADARSLVAKAPAGECYRVTDEWTGKTHDSNGNVSDASAISKLTADTCSGTAPPLAPSNIQLIIGEASATANATVTVKWNAVTQRTDGSAAQIAKYIVLLNSKNIAEVKGTQSLRTLAAGKCLEVTDKYSVQAVDTKGVKSAMPQSVAMPRKVCSPGSVGC